MITLKSDREIEKMKISGRILKKIIQKLKDYVAPGRTTQEIDDYAGRLISQENVTSAFKGYKGFPANICISINEEVVHGIPSKKEIKRGDIISLDAGVVYKGFFSDSAVTIPVGTIKASIKKLIDVTRESLRQGIKQAQPGKRLGNIGYSIQRYVEANGFSVVRQFVGHGIGRDLQEEPEIPNFGQPDQGLILKSGMTLAIEPMVNTGGWEVEILSNGWTVATKDMLPSAHFEHTIAITDKGPEILT